MMGNVGACMVVGGVGKCGWQHLYRVHRYLSSGQACARLSEHHRVNQQRGDALSPAGYGDGWEFARFTLRGVELPGDAAPIFLPGARPAQPSICIKSLTEDRFLLLPFRHMPVF